MSYAVESSPKWYARRSVQPLLEPVTLNQAKDFAKITEPDMDREVTAIITAARESVEKFLNRTLITTTWVMRMRGFPCGKIIVPHSPLIAVSSIVYDAASDGSATTLDAANYRASAYAEPGEIEPAFGFFWPTARDQSESVRVTFTAGYGTAASDVPGPIKHAILVLVATLERHREKILVGMSKEEVEEVCGHLLYPYRVFWM